MPHAPNADLSKEIFNYMLPISIVLLGIYIYWDFFKRKVNESNWESSFYGSMTIIILVVSIVGFGMTRCGTDTTHADPTQQSVAELDAKVKMMISAQTGDIIALADDATDPRSRTNYLLVLRNECSISAIPSYACSLLLQKLPEQPEKYLIGKNAKNILGVHHLDDPSYGFVVKDLLEQVIRDYEYSNLVTH